LGFRLEFVRVYELTEIIKGRIGGLFSPDVPPK
jgi:hypothetical protein